MTARLQILGTFSNQKAISEYSEAQSYHVYRVCCVYLEW